MKLLNVGCGHVFHSEWINIDLNPAIKEITQCDIRQSFPFSDDYFDACYCSHVIEHLTTGDSQNLLQEVFRTLKKGGFFRVVIPDLEDIARQYLGHLDKVEKGHPLAEANYDWMVLELYDQMVRSFKGGQMGRYLEQPKLANEDFILSRLGSELKIFRDQKGKSFWQKLRSKQPIWLLQQARYVLAESFVFLIAGRDAQRALREGLFRRSGEVHLWMYDRFSMKRLLNKTGFTHIKVCSADESSILDFNRYQLDTIDGQVRKPDSLFIEGMKP